MAFPHLIPSYRKSRLNSTSIIKAQFSTPSKGAAIILPCLQFVFKIWLCEQLLTLEERGCMQVPEMIRTPISTSDPSFIYTVNICMEGERWIVVLCPQIYLQMSAQTLHDACKPSAKEHEYRLRIRACCQNFIPTHVLVQWWD